MRILIIEGQGNFPFIKDQLIKPMLAKHPDAFKYLSIAWDDQIRNGVKYDIVIGHSLGGDRAIDYAYLNQPKYLLTLDPRWMSNWGWTDIFFRWQANFTAPRGVECYNFTHTPATLFPGYLVSGATNTSLFTTHLTLPGHPAVSSRLEQILRREGAIK